MYVYMYLLYYVLHLSTVLLYPLHDRSGRKKCMTGRNGRGFWERQGITAFCTCQWIDWSTWHVLLVVSFIQVQQILMRKNFTNVVIVDYVANYW